MTRRLLILVRHGEPQTGVGDDARLTAVGEQQVALLGTRLARLHVDRLVHSPLARAVHTAEILTKQLPHAPVTVDDSLEECLRPIPPPETLLPTECEWFAGVADELAEGRRITSSARDTWLRAPSPGAPDETIVAVSHGNLIRWLAAESIGAPDTWFRTLDYHCAMWTIVLRPERRPQLIGANDVGHLPADLRGREYPDELRV